MMKNIFHSILTFFALIATIEPINNKAHTVFGDLVDGPFKRSIYKRNIYFADPNTNQLVNLPPVLQIVGHIKLQQNVETKKATNNIVINDGQITNLYGGISSHVSEINGVGAARNIGRNSYGDGFVKEFQFGNADALNREQNTAISDYGVDANLALSEAQLTQLKGGISLQGGQISGVRGEANTKGNSLNNHGTGSAIQLQFRNGAISSEYKQGQNTNQVLNLLVRINGKVKLEQIDKVGKLVLSDAQITHLVGGTSLQGTTLNELRGTANSKGSGSNSLGSESTAQLQFGGFNSATRDSSGQVNYQERGIFHQNQDEDEYGALVTHSKFKSTIRGEAARNTLIESGSVLKAQSGNGGVSTPIRDNSGEVNYQDEGEYGVLITRSEFKPDAKGSASTKENNLNENASVLRAQLENGGVTPSLDNSEKVNYQGQGGISNQHQEDGEYGFLITRSKFESNIRESASKAKANSLNENGTVIKAQIENGDVSATIRDNSGQVNYQGGTLAQGEDHSFNQFEISATTVTKPSSEYLPPYTNNISLANQKINTIVQSRTSDDDSENHLLNGKSSHDVGLSIKSPIGSAQVSAKEFGASVGQPIRRLGHPLLKL
ncbi:uncharacterized protein LOC126736220 isoform X2 [Anthonomus grandis grandis]|uniref:uncharacterized protein LOC126736220 isoform X2 n=1 Tax=Anthonomus grandis grandis TaxID=2921223 RepID=UPI002166614A|nr:uncharacterized protein LOC126736220 isoform X2 [Anthonomus grandis grandis]